MQGVPGLLALQAGRSTRAATGPRKLNSPQGRQGEGVSARVCQEVPGSPGVALLGELGYSAWGLTRYAYGTILTDYRFTRRRYQDIIGLYDYSACCVVRTG